MPPSWHPVPACVPRPCCRRAVLSCSSEGAAAILKSGLEIKNRYTQEAVSGEKLTSILKSEPEIKNRCTQESVNRQNHALIPKSGLEIKNRCTQKDVSGEKLASIRKSEPEIKNHCTNEGTSRQNLAAILKSGLEIKNHCRLEGVLQADHSSLRQRRLGRIVAATTAAGGPFSFATTKNRIGCGRPLRRRRIESDAEGRCGDGRSRRAIFHRHDDYTASILKSGPEIKNHCTLEDVSRQNLAAIPKFTP